MVASPRSLRMTFLCFDHVKASQAKTPLRHLGIISRCFFAYIALQGKWRQDVVGVHLRYWRIVKHIVEGCRSRAWRTPPHFNFGKVLSLVAFVRHSVWKDWCLFLSCNVACFDALNAVFVWEGMVGPKLKTNLQRKKIFKQTRYSNLNPKNAVLVCNVRTPELAKLYHEQTCKRVQTKLSCQFLHLDTVGGIQGSSNCCQWNRCCEADRPKDLQEGHDFGIQDILKAERVTPLSIDVSLCKLLNSWKFLDWDQLGLHRQNCRVQQVEDRGPTHASHPQSAPHMQDHVHLLPDITGSSVYV